MTRLIFVLVVVLVLASRTPVSRAVEKPPQQVDIVIYGGTSAGVIAAAAARRMDKSVVLIEPGQHLGGLSSGGLGWTDSGNKSVIGGLAREFYRRIKQHYDRDQVWKWERPEQFARYRKNDDAMWTFEPHVAENVFRTMIRQAKAPVLFGERLAARNAVEKKGARITAIRTESGKTIRGQVFLDCTYEGDLLAQAKVSYTVGREANAQYNETLNGVATRLNTHKHRFLKPVDPYVKPGDPVSGLLFGIDPKGPGREGTGDHRVQAYNYRLCITDVKANQAPFQKPPGYDEAQYELLLRNFEAGDLRLPLKIDMMPNRKTDVNNNCAVSTDFIGRNYDYPEGDYPTRRKILAEHAAYTKGLMWTLANHPRVPRKIRDQISQWGWAKDEFPDTNHFAHQIYVREARRMVSDFVMTERHLRALMPTPQPVGMGSYNMDSHNVQRYVTAEGNVQNEGDVQVSPGGPYPISYRSLTPKSSQCTNLLVPVCVSSSHIAYGSIRMEPVFMILGQSAATAASLAIDEKVAVQDVPYPKLRARLLADGQILHYERRTPTADFRVRGLKGIVLDDTDAKKIGAWTPSASVGPLYGSGYLHDGNAEQGSKRVVFTPKIEQAGRYEVRILFSAHGNRATKVSVTIQSAGGRKTVRVNQRRAPKPGPLLPLGVYEFAVGKQGAITISNAGADGYVIVDAVQLLGHNTEH